MKKKPNVPYSAYSTYFTNLIQDKIVLKESQISSFAIQTHRSNQPHLPIPHTKELHKYISSYNHSFQQKYIHISEQNSQKHLVFLELVLGGEKAKEYKHNKYVSYVVSHVRICPVLWRTACGDGDGGVECQMRKNKGPWKGWHLSKRKS